jgi:hypothetical protein
MGGQSINPSILKKKYHLKVQKYKDLATRPIKPCMKEQGLIAYIQ